MFDFNLLKFEMQRKNTEELKKTIKRLKNSNHWGHDKIKLKFAKEELKTRL